MVGQEIESLRKKVAFHNYLYHVCDNPIISDCEFDVLYDKLKRLELDHPQYFCKDSPTQKIDGYFDKIKHLLKS